MNNTQPGHALKKSELFLLVKSLSNTEKAYFQKLAKRHATGKQALHIRLLHLINKADENDETLFIKRLSINSQAQFSMLKKYLFHEILEALLFQYRYQINGVESDKQIMQIKILIDRKLFKSARILIDKEKKAADKNQFLLKKLRILKIEFELVHFTDMDQLHTHHRLISEQLKKVFQFEALFDQYRHLIVLRNVSNNRITKDEINEAKEELAHLEKMKVEASDPTITTILYKACLALAHYLCSGHLESTRHRDANMELWKKHAYLIKSHSSIFLEDAITALYISFSNWDKDYIEALLAVLRKLALNMENDGLYKRWQIVEFNARLKLCHKNADYDKLKGIVYGEAAFVDGLAGQVLPLTEHLTIISSMAISYYVLGDLKAADHALFRVKELLSSAMRVDVFYFVQVFHLLIIYESGDMYRLASATEAAYRQLYKRKPIRAFEKDVMQFIRNLASAKDHLYRDDLIKKALTKLDEYHNDPVKKMYFQYFNYHAWLKSKLMNMRYPDYVKWQLPSAGSE